jgi:hypothetical protein
VLTDFSQPYDTWAGMRQVPPGEAWPPSLNVKSVQYFCGTLALPEPSLPPAADTGLPTRADDLAKANALRLLRYRARRAATRKRSPARATSIDRLHSRTSAAHRFPEASWWRESS